MWNVLNWLMFTFRYYILTEHEQILYLRQLKIVCELIREQNWYFSRNQVAIKYSLHIEIFEVGEFRYFYSFWIWGLAEKSHRFNNFSVRLTCDNSSLTKGLHFCYHEGKLHGDACNCPATWCLGHTYLSTTFSSASYRFHVVNRMIIFSKSSEYFRKVASKWILKKYGFDFFFARKCDWFNKKRSIILASF